MSILQVGLPQSATRKCCLKPPEALDIPTEIWQKIFEYLDFSSLAKCASVCTKFNELTRQASLYRKLDLNEDSCHGFVRWFLLKGYSPRSLISNDFPLFRDVLTPTLRYWSSLEKLYLYNADLQNAFDLPLTQLRNLTLLQCIIRHETLAQLLRNNGKLCSVILEDNLCFCGQCDDRSGHGRVRLDQLQCCHHLKVVHISTSERTLTGLQRLSDCANLITLTIRQNIWREPREDHHDSVALESIGTNCTKLQDLRLGELDYVSDGVLAIFFRNCPSLKVIRLEGLNFITANSCLLAITNLSKLEKLYAQDCKQITKNTEEPILQKALQEANKTITLVIT